MNIRGDVSRGVTNPAGGLGVAAMVLRFAKKKRDGIANKAEDEALADKIYLTIKELERLGWRPNCIRCADDLLVGECNDR